MTPSQIAIGGLVLSVVVNTGLLVLAKKAFAALLLQELANHFPRVEDYKRDTLGISGRIDQANSASQLAVQMAERATETGERAVQEAKSTRDLLDRLHERIVQDFVEPIQDHGRVLSDVGKALAALTTETKANSDLLGKLLDRELDGAK